MFFITKASFTHDGLHNFKSRSQRPLLLLERKSPRKADEELILETPS